MKLSEWLRGDATAVPPRPRVTQAELASRVGCSTTLIVAYCNGSVWPGRDNMRAIKRETAGLVTADDFLLEPAE